MESFEKFEGSLEELNGPQQDYTLHKGLFYVIFCLGSPLEVAFSPVYSRMLAPGRAFIIYDPDRDLICQFKSEEGTRLFMLSMGLSTLHGMFAPESNNAPVFLPENSQRRFYEERVIVTEVQRILQHYQEVRLSESAQRLYQKAKCIEVVSLFFSKERADTDACPFLNNDEMVRKLKKAKDLLIQHYMNPVTLPNIARQVGLNELQLKKGFKEVYGNTPYQFVLDYKLEIARQLILREQLPVNEIADRIGYTNVSHFITAFRRKFGMTPKKYNT
ncbi:MAG: AraC family transcriptional regulator [Saprospiraceae bacterium]